MKKNPNEKSPNENPRLVISFDSTDLFTPSEDLKKDAFGYHISGKGEPTLLDKCRLRKLNEYFVVI